MGVANTLSACFNTGLLCYALRRKLARLGLTGLVHSLLILAPNALLAGVVAGVLGWFWERRLGHATLPLKVGAVFVPAAAAVLVYWLVALWAGIAAPREMIEAVRQKLGRLRGKG